jgi:hypothetical protein
MTLESQSPANLPERCPECGEWLEIQPTHRVEDDLQCNKCYARISFVRLKGTVYAYPATRRNRSKQMEANRRELSRAIPETVAREHRVCPIVAVDNLVSVVTSEANTDELRAKLQSICNCKIHIMQGEADMVDWMIEQQYQK